MSKARRYAFTWNNYTETNVDNLLRSTEKDFDYCVFGFEVCPETQTKHLQGYVEFKSPLSMTACKGRLDKISKKNSTIHVEIAKSNRDANINYCKKSESKDESRSPFFHEITFKNKNQGQRTDWHEMVEFIKDGKDMIEFADTYPEAAMKYYGSIDKLIKLNKHKYQRELLSEEFENFIFRPWQAELIKELRGKPNDRKIIWYYDEKGNSGKSKICKYLLAEGNTAYFTNSSSNNISYAYNYEPIVVFDFTRSTEGVLNYTSMEQFKTGFCFSGKYESSGKVFASPHVVCMANFMPRLDAMSADRWCIRKIDLIGDEWRVYDISKKEDHVLCMVDYLNQYN